MRVVCQDEPARVIVTARVPDLLVSLHQPKEIKMLGNRPFPTLVGRWSDSVDPSHALTYKEETKTTEPSQPYMGSIACVH